MSKSMYLKQTKFFSCRSIRSLLHGLVAPAHSKEKDWQSEEKCLAQDIIGQINLSQILRINCKNPHSHTSSCSQIGLAHNDRMSYLSYGLDVGNMTSFPHFLTSRAEMHGENSSIEQPLSCNKFPHNSCLSALMPVTTISISSVKLPINNKSHISPFAHVIFNEWWMTFHPSIVRY